MSASAQAYLGESNSLSASLGYSYAPSGKIILSSEEGGAAPLDDELPNVPVQVHIFNLGTQYNTPVDGLALEASLPLVGVKLGEDSFVHGPIPGEYDDGDMHFTFTDFRGDLRYQVKSIEEYLGLSFAVGGTIPVRDYPTNGFANPGSHLKALILGVALARTLDPVIPNLFFQVQYDFSLREKVDITPETESFNRNQSDWGFLLGYFLPAGVYIDAGLDLRYTHGGLTYVTIPLYEPTTVVNHDRLLDEDNATAGGDLGYQINEDLSIAASARFFVWGHDTRNHNLFGLNFDYRLF